MDHMNDPSRKPLSAATKDRLSSQPEAVAAEKNFKGARIHGRIVRALAAIVLGGDLAPGDLLPNEDDLAERFGVSRSSVREAVKTLSAKGLIESRQRVGARIRPRDDWRLLDPTLLSWHPNIRHDVELVQGIVEARRVFEPAAAALAASRATTDDIRRIKQAFAGMEEAPPEDIVACCEADLGFHRSVIEASHNPVLRELVGAIEAALRASFLATNEWVDGHSTVLQAHQRVMDYIVAGDAAGAKAAMSHVLDMADNQLRRS